VSFIVVTDYTEVFMAQIFSLSPDEHCDGAFSVLQREGVIIQSVFNSNMILLFLLRGLQSIMKLSFFYDFSPLVPIL
jgi:hypothetical protein